MRVIAGSARGRRLVAPSGRDVRPTGDRVREALFSVLADVVPAAHVLDLFAGSGALGIEALSRGAAQAVFVERDPRAVEAIERNLAATGMQEHAVVRREDTAAFARRPHMPRTDLRGADAGYDLVLCDPPYAFPLPAVYQLVEALHVAGALACDAVVVIERDRRDPELDTPPPAFLASGRRRTYGDTVLLTLRVDPEQERAQEEGQR